MSADKKTTPDERSAPAQLKPPALTVLPGRDEDTVYGNVFDPVGNGAWTETQAAELLASRLHQRNFIAYDAVRDAWLQLGTDPNGQPVWQIVATNPLDYARAMVVAVQRAVVKGDTASDEGKARARMYTRFNTSAGVGALARLLLDQARLPGSVMHTRAETIDADEKADQLWAGGRLWFLDARMHREYGDEGLKSGYTSHDRVHLRTAACAPDSSCPTPLWDEFLDAVFADSDEDRNYFMAVMGVCVTGTSDRVLPILFGPSGRGKSYAMRLVLSVMGSYGYTAPATLLGEHSDRAHEAELEGRRLVFVDEGPRAGRLATERLKALTGGTRQTTRALYARPTSWDPKYTLVMTSNELPPVADPAVRARLRPVDFGDANADEVKAVAAKIGDPETSKAWREEMPGVLAQLMVKAGEYLHDRSVADVPAWMNEAVDDMASEQNPVMAWLEDRTTEGETKAMDLYTDFVAWCSRVGIRVPWTLNKWGQTMTDLGHPARKTTGIKVRPRALKPLAMGFMGTPTTNGETTGTLNAGGVQ